MHETEWLLVCLVAFIAITFKPVKAVILNLIAKAQESISVEIHAAEDVYSAAFESLEEAKSLYLQLENTRKYIIDKEEGEIEFDIKQKSEEFEEFLKVKEEQIENQINRETLLLKDSILSKIAYGVKKKFIQKISKNPELEDFYTDIMLDNN